MNKKFKYISILFITLFVFQFISYYPVCNAVDESSEALTSDDSTTDDSTVDNAEAEKIEKNFTFPEGMKGIEITPGKDYFKDLNQSQDNTNKEIKNIINNVIDFRLDTIIINTSYNGVGYYDPSSLSSKKEMAVTSLIKAAKESNLFVYVTFDINYVLNDIKSDLLQTKINYLAHVAHKFARDYLVDGIILQGYYQKNNVESYDSYLKYGSGIGFSSWLYDNSAYAFSLVSDAIHTTKNTIPVGIKISDPWANVKTNEQGSNTAADFEAYTDGYADTLKFIKDGYADFIMVDAYGSLTDRTLPFTSYCSWWSKQAVNANIPLYIEHSNNKLCSSQAGWTMTDQIVRQLVDAKKIPGVKGSCFKSYSQLLSNSVATNAMIKFFDDNLDINSLLKELEMTSPKKTTFTTYEPNVIFAGSFDSNFDVTLNGKKIELNKIGRFYYQLPLDIGRNSFKIENKGKVVTYNITRKVKVLNDVFPVSKIVADGKNIIEVTAVAYKGSVVTAKLNGKTVTLKETDSEWEGSDPNSSYALFKSEITLPAGIVGKVQNLGNIKFNASYMGNYESRTGSNVIVNAKEEIKVVPPPAPGETPKPAKLVKITYPYNALIYDANKISRYPIPLTRLPSGTLDYYSKTVTYDHGTYYQTQSGRLIKSTQATIIDSNTFAANTVKVNGVQVQNYDTVMTLDLGYSTPFNISYNSISLSSGSAGALTSSFKPSSITITFDYAVPQGGDIAFPSGSLFTSGSWSKTKDEYGRDQSKLTLTLNKSGGYSGVFSSYNGNTLTLRFNGHPSSLNGAIIAIDPGHGYTGSYFDPGAIGQVTEQSVNLAVSKMLESKLTAAGATVYRLPTESQHYVTADRPNIALKYTPDIFLSIHCNSGSSNPKGATEAFYFNAFSQPFAQYITSELTDTWLSINSSFTNRGAKYDTYLVTEQDAFPSTLVEIGFVSSYEQGITLGQECYQEMFAQDMADAIAQYFSNN